MRRSKSTLATGEPSRPFAMKSAGSVKPVGSVKSTGMIEGIAIDKNSAVRDVGVVVVKNSVVMPVVSPVVPAPAESAVEADSKP